MLCRGALDPFCEAEECIVPTWEQAAARGPLRRLSGPPDLPPPTCQLMNVGDRVHIPGPRPETGYFALPSGGMACSATAQNAQLAGTTDTFRTSVINKTLIVTRIDSADQWGQYLQLYCCPPGSLQYMGCYAEGASAMLACGMQSYPSANSTELCRQYCAGYTHFALRNGSCCSCGNTYSRAKEFFALTDTDCGEVCDGEEALLPTRLCGGNGTWAVYAHGTSCAAPTVSNQSVAGACLEGSTIAHGGTCTPQCLPKFVPSHWFLNCSAGSLSPAATFTCIEVFGNCTAPTGIAFANSGGSCLEGVNLPHTGTCTSWCHPWYTPTVRQLSCYDNVLTPATFQCLPTPCAAPDIIFLVYTTGIVQNEVAYVTCVEGPIIPHLGTCTPVCDVGHRLVPSSVPPDGLLRCVGGTFTPPFFSCTPACRNDTDCSGHGTCQASKIAGQSFCQCDYFLQPGAAWTYASIMFGAGLGVAAIDGRTDTAFLMYTAASTQTRFPTVPTGAITNAVVVSFSSTSDGRRWFYDDNKQMQTFQPLSTDTLVAQLNFANQTAALLQDSTMGLASYGGIRRGYWRQTGLAMTPNATLFSTDYCNPTTYDPPGSARYASSGNATLGMINSSTAWSPATAGSTERYVMDAGSVQTVTALVIRGRGDASRWVTSFYLDISSDNSTWQQLSWTQTIPEFPGANDKNSYNQVTFSSPLVTRFVRITPRTWYPSAPTPPALRAAIVICVGDPPGGEILLNSSAVVMLLDRCSEPLVLDPPDSSRSASSVLGGSLPGTGNHRGRLNGTGWLAATTAVAGANLWYQIDLGLPSLLRAVVIMGALNQWTTLLTLAGSNDTVAWIALADNQSFTGNVDNSTQVFLEFGAPVGVRYLRLYPQKWSGGAALRAGVVLCQPPLTASAPIPAYSGALCSAEPGSQWALFNAAPLDSYWEVREVRFFGDAACTWPLDTSTPISSGNAWIERSLASRGPVEYRAANAFDGLRDSTWASSCAFPCQAGAAYIGVSVRTPAAVRCVWLEQHGAPDRTASAVQLRVRTTAQTQWRPQTSWYGLPRICAGGAGCALAVFSS